MSQSTHEFGVRLALGAERRSVLSLVLKRGSLVAALGLGLGLAVSLLATASLDSLLYEVEPLDAGTYAAVLGAMALVIGVATLVPAGSYT